MSHSTSESQFAVRDARVNSQDGSQKFVFTIIKNLAEQLSQLHQRNRIHRRINASTARVDDRGIPNLEPPGPAVDFGSGVSDLEQCPPELQVRQTISLTSNLAAAREALSANGLDVDPRRVDVYQLGTYLCRLLTNESVSSYLCSPKLMAKVPPDFRELIDRSLGYEGHRAFENVDEFSKALAKLQDGSATTEGIENNKQSIRDDRDKDTSPRISTAEVQGDTSAGTNAPRTSLNKADISEKLGVYEIVRKLGQGGMGDVYEAYDPALQRRVAIKVLPSQFARDKDLICRFHAEAAATARLIHPNVVQIFFTGEDNGHHFFAMQYVDGESVSELLSRQKKLTVEETLAIIQQTLAGLAAAHKLDLIHRDVKPANLLVDREAQRVLLADFGLVKDVRSSEQITATGVVMGTVDYISPEQGRGQTIDCRSDLYSVGVMMYRMLSGKLPFEANSATAMIFHHAYEEPVPLHEVAPDVPAPLSAIVEKLMEKSVSDRYQDCEEVLEALQDLGFPESPYDFKDVLGHEKSAGLIDERKKTSIVVPPDSPESPQVAAATVEPQESQRQAAQLQYQSTHDARKSGMPQWVSWAAVILGLTCFAVLLWAIGGRTPSQSKIDDSTADVEPTATATSEHPSTTENPSTTEHQRLTEILAVDEWMLFDVAFSPDGNTLAAGSDGGIVKVWDVATRLEIHSLLGPGSVHAVAYSPDSKMLASAHKEKSIVLWNLSTGKHLKILEIPSDNSVAVESVVFSPDGKLLASGSSDSSALLWDVATGEVRAKLSGHSGGIREVAFSADGKMLASASADKTIRLWDVDSGSLLYSMDNRMPLYAAKFSPNKNILASGAHESPLKMWDTETGQLLRRQSGHQKYIHAVAFSQDGRFLASASADRTVRLWDAETGELLETVFGHTDRIQGVAFSPDGKTLATASQDKTLRLWPIATVTTTAPDSSPYLVAVPGDSPVPLVEGIRVYKNTHRYHYANLPEPLAGGFVIFRGGNIRRNRTHYDIGNTTHFRVLRNGTVFLIMSGRPGGGGKQGAWRNEIIDHGQLLECGWRPVGKLDHIRGQTGEVLRQSAVYQRQCKRGESFTYAWEKYIPPAVVVPDINQEGSKGFTTRSIDLLAAYEQNKWENVVPNQGSWREDIDSYQIMGGGGGGPDFGWAYPLRETGDTFAVRMRFRMGDEGAVKLTFQPSPVVGTGKGVALDYRWKPGLRIGELSFTGGDVTVTPFEPLANRWHTLLVEVEPNRMKVQLDGVEYPAWEGAVVPSCICLACDAIKNLFVSELTLVAKSLPNPSSPLYSIGDYERDVKMVFDTNSLSTVRADALRRLFIHRAQVEKEDELQTMILENGLNKSVDRKVRRLGLELLAYKGLAKDELFPLFESVVLDQGEHQDFRMSALGFMLKMHAKDPRMIPIMKRVSSHTWGHYGERRPALTFLSQYMTDADVVAIMKSRVADKKTWTDRFERQIAIETLTTHMPDDPEITALMQEAVTDSTRHEEEIGLIQKYLDQ